MSNLEIRTRQVDVPNGDLKIAAYLAEPVGEGPYPTVVVIQEIFGVNAHIREVTERFARSGYRAIAPAIYQRLAPGFETGYTPEAIQIGRQYKDQTKAVELLADIQATIDYVKAHCAIKSQGFGCIGFCFGGHVAYLVSTLPDIQATASFYGAGITTMTPGGGAPTLSRTADIQGTLYAFFGMQDASIPVEQVNQIEAALQEHHIPHKVLRYPDAEHGFFCDHRASYNPAAATAAWEEVQELFGHKL
ncbi:carboxymethylenebutenolidase [Leptolyngbya sp. 'hensonii']|uniref:dienelactone hydrolase family protein n=1 Tax=Leptolyngbya sp. 'hensonii' TaxID=1922337 RepID=UPI00094FEA57|nr:dienelactone hydrolase family protein [Leptolyngbya sp. 'hensonii']OLP20166.1 carboxymethylenebutenolidase [Leptolyngbya sp. 'hensonii']